MVSDFGDISKVVKPLLETILDHHFLNDTTGLDNPTSEALARWIFDQLKDKVLGLRAHMSTKLLAVEVDETCTSSCRYEP
jgi:6-pyruvoyltetrahydropterin/6-carboxytetrahydropterin synthase